MTDDVALRLDLVDKLIADGVLCDPNWIDTFSVVPRHQFTPAFWHRTETEARRLDGADPAQRDEWLTLAYADTPLITQFDPGSTATSASSQPSVMARMLEALDVETGHRVLEAGTGTGYNAALLAHRLGDDRVTTVEVDASLSAAAQSATAAAGYRPTVVVGDALAGYPPRAPYDRIIGTFGISLVPPAWIHQLADAGVLVANLGYAIARLRKDGDVLSGSFLQGFAAFMVARNPDETAFTHRDAMELCAGSGTARPVRIPTDIDDPDLLSFTRLFLPELTRFARTDEDSVVEYGLADPATQSWALATSAGTVTEGGSRQLWAELDRIHTRWRNAGRPDPSRLRLRISADGTHAVSVAGTALEWDLNRLATAA